MSDKSSEKPEMSFTAEGSRSEMQERVRTIAALAPEDNRKAALRFAASVLRMPYGRVKRLYYGEARRVEAHEADQIRAYCEAAIKLVEARAQYEALRADYLKNAHPALVGLAPSAPGRAEVHQAAEGVAARARRRARR